MVRGRVNRRVSDGKAVEAYEHADKTRLNNPPVGLVTPDSDADRPARRYAYDPHLDPQLVWAGKAEHTSFEVPTVSLPFAMGERRRAAVKIVDDRGIESLKIVELG